MCTLMIRIQSYSLTAEGRRVGMQEVTCSRLCTDLERREAFEFESGCPSRPHFTSYTITGWAVSQYITDFRPALTVLRLSRHFAF